MLYLNDVWVNWFEGEESGLGVCPFYEWRKSDHIELLDQVPVLKIEANLFARIENSLEELPSNLLKDIHQQAFIRKNQERITLDYCAVFTDGIGVIAVSTIGYTIPIRKSRLIPKQEEKILDMVELVNYRRYAIQKSSNAHMTSKDDLIEQPIPSLIGLSRKERQLQKVLQMALDLIQSSQNVAEIRYWFTEWCPERYQEVAKLDFQEAWTDLATSLLKGWSRRNQAICEKMIKGHTYLEQLWEIELGDRPIIR